MSDTLIDGILFVLLVEVYLFPAVIAWARRHRNRAAIILLDILLGWTLLGWIAAMVWAFTFTDLGRDPGDEDDSNR
jgi:Superinfection immunity protein